MTHVFDGPKMLVQLNDETRAATKSFNATMEAFSEEVSTRQFNEDGLSQGMPLLWKALDPNVIPYSVSI